MQNPVVVWIDDEGTCEPPVCKGGDHHLYVDEYGRKWVFRCPKSLSAKENGQVFFDQPPGSAREKVKEFRDMLMEENRQSRKKGAER